MTSKELDEKITALGKDILLYLVDKNTSQPKLHDEMKKIIHECIETVASPSDHLTLSPSIGDFQLSYNTIKKKTRELLK